MPPNCADIGCISIKTLAARIWVFCAPTNGGGIGDRVYTRGAARLARAVRALCVPKTSSTSCDQAIFVNQATDMSLFSDAVLVEIDRFG